MNRASDHRLWTLALCLSLIIHGGALAWLIHGYLGELLAALPQPPLVRAATDENDTLIYANSGDDQRRLVLGDSTGSGYAVNASEGAESMLARQGPEDQAWLSRDPVGLGGESTDPVSALPARGHSAPSDAILPKPTEAARPFGVAPAGQGVPQRKVALPSSAIAMGEPMRQAEFAQAPDPVAQPQAAGEAAVAAAPASSAGGAVPAGDPAPMSESDSDPFSRIGSAEFRPGKVDVKLGRKFKITRPRLLLAGRNALLAFRFPSLVLKIDIDETGKVTAVDVLRSSGSNEIDQPCQLAAYDWWFEPSRNAEGQPVADVIFFTIQWR